ncbi:hypothetical protein GCM10023149_50470 [Mucilaginibacter gynuensis]|uniref:Peptidase M23-like protein n=1 Tax=Mucilaginibacter gynuensis TaxID=1302236 RepID=A0ABP8HI38_9SPHI
MFCLPLKYLHLNSAFGHRVHPLTGKYACHLGIDLKARSDTVFSILDGRIAAIGYNPQLGIFIKMAHGPVTITYGHLNTPGLSGRQRINGNTDRHHRPKR